MIFKKKKRTKKRKRDQEAYHYALLPSLHTLQHSEPFIEAQTIEMWKTLRNMEVS